MAPVMAVAAGYAAACGVVLALGFDHISDDDFARVTIAQTFASHPKVDPSGTSWLPFPFWAMGAAMLLFGFPPVFGERFIEERADRIQTRTA